MQDFGHGFFGGGFMWIFWILLIVILVWVIKMVADNAGSRPPKHSPREEESALDILNKRYARGEIDRDEFEQKKKDLEQ